MDYSLFPVNIEPLLKTHADNDVEQELYQIFCDVFEEYVRDKERDVNVSGMPHLGSFDLVSRHVEKDGLALINNGDEAAMRYLFKAWKARNPKRGLHFLNTYLQLLFDWHEVDQLWQRKDEEYPKSLLPEYRINDSIDNHYLTSRLAIFVRFDGLPESILRIKPAIRSILPMRLMFAIGVLVPASGSLAIGQNLAISASNDREIIADPVSFRSQESRISYGSSLGVSASFDIDCSPQSIGIRDSVAAFSTASACSMSASLNHEAVADSVYFRGNESKAVTASACSMSASLNWSFA